MARYALTIFLSAFLLFQVQPMIGKVILPWYGGGPAVWTSCMLFFQVFLLGGYAYAHLVASRMTARVGTSLHWALLVGSLLFLPIAPNPDVWKQAAENVPVAQILALLAVTIGLPYFLLSSTGPLLQESYRRETGHPPYRLYALSNVGSLLALLTYPFVFEPQLTLRTQVWSWSLAYVVFAVLSAWCVLGLLRRGAQASDEVLPGGEATGTTAPLVAPSWRDVGLWVALAACGSVLLLATTNQLCQEVTTVPFLWVVPLALYLTTFIICFDHERWYHRPTFLVLLLVALFAASYALFEGTKLGLWKQVACYCGALWVCCMVCHGELVRGKPAPRFATLFYLMVSVGGAVGGVLVAVVAPLVLPDYWEYQLALFATVVLAFWMTWRDARREKVKPVSVWIAGVDLMTAVGLALIGIMATTQAASDLNETNLETTRNFYGVLRVNRAENLGDENGPYVELIHGRIRHGSQYLEPPYSEQPTTYYGPPTGVGLALDYHPKRAAAGRSAGEAAASTADLPMRGGPLRIGVIGLGCGTLAAYGRPGDTMRFYDINPAVIRIANEYFSYCKDSAATVEIVLGDARINLERELAEGATQQYDVLAVDAFSSDSIPMHLLTRECVELYRRHLAPDGLLCLHVSNQFLNLDGVVRGMAEVLGCECVRIESSSNHDEGLDTTSWIILTNNRAFLDSPEVRGSIKRWTADDPAPLVWTDDYGSLWQVLAK
ncbi:MAG: fused MFS/spermidine synthase [Pirellulales bacterium]